MARELNGAELAGFIKERQLRQVRNLRQQYKIQPRLLILKDKSATAVVDTYIRMKQTYAADLGIEVEVDVVDQDNLENKIQKANIDSKIHGIIVQLPLSNFSQIDETLSKILTKKDVDGLGDNADYPSATAEAIDWLVNGYNVELQGKRIAVVGRGRLVGRPLEKLWNDAGYNVVSYDIDSGDFHAELKNSQVIVSATGSPGLIQNADISVGAVVIDAGTASENGVIVGDVAPEVRERKDISITPVRGGVGPLTIAVLFDHLIQAALKTTTQK